MTATCALRWVPEDPTALLGVVLSDSGRVLEVGVTLDEAAALYPEVVLRTRLRLTRRGQAVLIGAIYAAALTFGFLSVPLGIFWS